MTAWYDGEVIYVKVKSVGLRLPWLTCPWCDQVSLITTGRGFVLMLAHCQAQHPEQLGGETDRLGLDAVEREKCALKAIDTYGVPQVG